MEIRRISIPSECYDMLQRESQMMTALKSAIDRECKLGVDVYETAVSYKAHQYLLEYYKDMVDSELSHIPNLRRWAIDTERPNTLILYMHDKEVN
jgi:hypothetical protein